MFPGGTQEGDGSELERKDVTLTFLRMIGTQFDINDSIVVRTIAEKTGVHLDFTPTVRSSSMEAVTLMVASRDIPDLIYLTTELGKKLEKSAHLIDTIGQFAWEELGTMSN